MSKISTIIFDWAGVFCSPAEPFSHPEFLRLAKMDADSITKRVKPLYNEYYRGEIASEEFWGEVLKSFKISGLNHAELNRAYLNSYALYPEMIDLAKNLKKNYTVALLSNLTNEMTRHILAKHKIKSCFHKLFFSNQLGLMKPDKEIFLYALKTLKASPAETIFIDDSLENIVAAEKLGLNIIHFKSQNQCVAELKKMGSALQFNF